MSWESIPPGPETENLFGGWLEIAQMVARFVSQLPGHGGASVVVDLLGALTDAQDGQAALLKSIKADTAALRKSPWKQAVESLADARRVGPTDPSWGRFLDRAEAKLSEARQLVSDMREAALVEYDRGIVWLFIGHEVNARYYLQEGVQCADRVVDEYVRKSGGAIEDLRTERRPTRFRGRDAATLAAMLGTVAITNGLLSPNGNYLDAMTLGGRRACRNLERFIGFYNLIQRTASSVSGGAQPRYLVLSGPEEPLVKGLFRKSSGTYFLDSPYVLRQLDT